MSLWLLLFTLLPRPESCQPIHSDQISGADLARAIPEFSRIPGDTIVGNSPTAGNRRVLTPAELARLGKQYGVDASTLSKGACFEWKTRALAEDDVRAAIRETLRSPAANVEVVAMSKANAPEGKLIFPVSGLSASTNADPATPVTWRGEVIYPSARKFQVWARVKISASMTRVVAKEMLLPGRTVTVGQVRVETLNDFPLRNDIARTLDDVVGRTPLHAVRPGAPVMRTDLREPFQVQRGEIVQVTAIAGAAELKMEAVAQNSGKQGDVISLKNPRTGKLFRARVEGRDEARILVAPLALMAGAQ